MNKFRKKKEGIIPHTYAKVKCECGYVICFHNNYPCICWVCGRKVYPTEQSKFKDKMKITIRRKNNE